MSVIKVDSDGASCQDVVCHVRFLLPLLLPWLSRPAHASPAALGAARGLVQRPAHEDAAVQEHLLGGDTVGWSVHGSGDHLDHSQCHGVSVAHGVCPASPPAAKTAALSASLCALSRETG